ncbi:MAG TPA: cation diffusion facilitator family transporter [Jatrophihabitans sp.]|nr:cation diffusion facilitator family transporter [Jatrophihabitans sp.]
MTDEQQNKQDAGDKSGVTVLLALAANAVIAVAKFMVGASTGSAAMLSEGAHSVADTFNQGFLFTAIKRSERPPDVDHPFGYGKERFFWSLLAAVGIMVAGAGFSLLEAYRAIFGSKSGEESYLWAFVVLGFAFLLEGTSWARAVWQTRSEARQADLGIVEHVRVSSDPTVKTVASEDSAALVGIAFAAAGLLLHKVTGQQYWEGIASLLIAILLIFVAYALGADAKGMLIGEAATERTREQIEDQLRNTEGIDEVIEVLTMRMGTGKVLVAARIDLEADLGAEDVEELSTKIEQDMHAAIPEVYQVFLDATDKGVAQQAH